MNENEANEWISTEAGAAWLTGQKSGLLGKNTELLKALKDGNAALSATAQRAADAERLLAIERSAVEMTVVDGELGRLLKNAGAIAPAIPGLVTELKEAHGLTVAADGAARKAIGKMLATGPDGSEIEVDAGLGEIVAAWAKTPQAKELTIDQGGTGGGAPGSGRGAAPAAPSLGSLSGRDLARMSDSDFKTAIDLARKGN